MKHDLHLERCVVIAELHRKREERFSMGNEAVKNIVILIWMDLETNRQVDGRGKYFKY